jgi:small subunit ribosomal protein S1
MTTKGKDTMEALVKEWGNKLVPFKEGDVVSVTVLSKSRNRLLVDVEGLRLGVIPVREFSREMPEVTEGASVFASILSMENDDSYVVLSLKRADRERLLRTIKEKYEKGEPLAVKVTDANYGGLIVEYGGLQGFLPVSQLALHHYPKVKEGQRNVILEKLKELIGQTLTVKILSIDPVGPRVIFSEKAAGDVLQEEEIKKFLVGQKVKTIVSGIVDFGLFVNLGKIEGLIHASEVSWVKPVRPGIADLKKRFEIGQEIDAQVVSLDKGRISLSMKRLDPKPWREAAKGLKVGSTVEAEVTRVTPFGAFVQITPILDGLVHISELGENVADPRTVIKEGDKKTFRILSIDPASFKISLSLKQVGTAPPTTRSPKAKSSPKKKA